MTKSKVRNYSETKAKRANNHQQTLIRKLQRSLNNRTDSEKAWDDEITKIQNAYVSVVCDVCKKPHQIEFKDWQVGKYRRTCYICILKTENAEKQEIVKQIKKNLSENV